ncbi:MAG: VWA domain-containing protein [Pirellulaceae bacterium]|nr:VWA domain-containing protein [Pirellulaceae bacterium]
MKTDLTDITLVVDRSGSMESIRDDAQGGINAFIREQAGLPGQALITLVQFDTDYEFLAKGVPATDIAPYELQPRGATALLDAIGRAINETGQRLSQINESDRPGLVVFVVMTDGLENSSREFTTNKIKQMIEHQQTHYQWQFTFLGADQDAFAEAGALGIAAGGAATFAKQKVRAAYRGTSSNVARMRQQTMCGEAVQNQYSESELREMGDD